MRALDRYVPIIGAVTGAFAMVAAVAGWIWGAAVLATRLELVQSTVTATSANVEDQGRAIARIEGALGLQPARVGLLSP